MQKPCSMHSSTGALLPKGRGLAGRPARAPACVQTVKCSAATVGAPSLRRQGARQQLHAALLHALLAQRPWPCELTSLSRDSARYLKRGVHVCAEMLTPGDEGVIIIGAGIGGLATAAALHKVRCSSKVVFNQGRRPARCSVPDLVFCPLQVGIPATVLERSPQLREEGGAIGMCAAAALKKLGV